MKKEDLRIGDLVKYESSIYAVAGIGSDDCITLLPAFTVEPGVVCSVNLQEITEITLDEDLLHVNGWEVVADGAYRKDGFIEVDFVSSGLRCFTIHSDKRNFVGYVETVSQLQHILHDIGLDSVMTIVPFEQEPTVKPSCKVMQIQSHMVAEPWKLMNYPDKTPCYELAVHCVAKPIINYQNNAYINDINDMCSILNSSNVEQPVRMITYVNDTIFMPTRYYTGRSNGDVYIINGDKIFAMGKAGWTEFESEKDAIHYIIHNSPAINPDLVVNLSDFE